MIGVPASKLVLAVHPFIRGIAFAVFEAAFSPVDWGTKDVRGSHRSQRSLEAAKQLIDRWRPDVIVLADTAGGYGRAKRLRRLRLLISGYAETQGVTVRTFSREDVQACFEPLGASTRFEIAQAIASRVPAFEVRLPAAPSVWDSKHVRMTVFDAAALVMTFYSLQGELLEPEESSQVRSDHGSSDK